MTKTEKMALIVDAYSSGALFAGELRSRGYACLHVQSHPEIPSVFAASYRPQEFEAALIHRGDAEALIAELSRYPVRCAIAGCDSGTMLADVISERLGLPTNGTALSAARRDKHLMTEAVRGAGLRTAQQLRSRELPSILAWIRADVGLPVVVKPTNSAGSEMVSLCSSEAEVSAAVETILRAENLLNLANDAVLAQEVLRGTEHVVDTVSCQGRHHVTDMWRYDKRPANGAHFVYHAAELLPFEGEEQRQLVEYTSGVLDALKIGYGPAHSEVMFTARGPTLVETAPRPHGGDAPAICRECIGYGQIDLTVDAYTDVARFLRVAGRPYRLEKHCTLVFLVSHQEGTLRALPRLDEIRALPSFHDLNLRVKPGEALQKTVHLFSSPGIVKLMHTDKSVVDSDHNRIRELEKEGFYLVESPAL